MTTTPSPTTRAPSPQRMAHALLSDRNAAPRPTAAACQTATAAQRAAAPFGHSSAPEFVCEVTLRGRRVTFAVQVLGNGCYVAERLRPGQAIYGCGV